MYYGKSRALSDKSKEKLVYAAKTTSDASVLRLFCNLGDELTEVKLAAAQNPYTPSDGISILLRENSPSILISAINHCNTRLTDVKPLTKHPDKQVRLAALDVMISTLHAIDPKGQEIKKYTDQKAAEIHSEIMSLNRGPFPFPKNAK